MKSKKIDEIQTSVKIATTVTVISYCSKCGTMLKLSEKSEKYNKKTGIESAKVVYIEPCDNCLTNRLNELKKLI